MSGTSDDSERVQRPGRLAAAPSRADLGIVAALTIEVRPLLGLLRRVRTYRGPRFKVIEGEVGGSLVAFVVTGPGRKAAGAGTRVLLDGHHPDWVLSVGFAGALDPGLPRNALVLAREVLDPEGRRFTIDLEVAPEAGAEGLASGRLLTVDQIVRTPREREALRAQFGADMVDMETSAVAAVCSDRQVRFLSIRAISDDAGAELPREIAALLAPSRPHRVGAVLGTLWRRPAAIRELLALRQNALDAAARLKAFFPVLVAELSRRRHLGSV